MFTQNLKQWIGRRQSYDRVTGISLVAGIAAAWLHGVAGYEGFANAIALAALVGAVTAYFSHHTPEQPVVGEAKHGE